MGVAGDGSPCSWAFFGFSSPDCLAAGLRAEIVFGRRWGQRFFGDSGRMLYRVFVVISTLFLGDILRDLRSFSEQMCGRFARRYDSFCSRSVLAGAAMRWLPAANGLFYERAAYVFVAIVLLTPVIVFSQYIRLDNGGTEPAKIGFPINTDVRRLIGE